MHPVGAVEGAGMAAPIGRGGGCEVGKILDAGGGVDGENNGAEREIFDPTVAGWRNRKSARVSSNPPRIRGNTQ